MAGTITAKVYNDEAIAGVAAHAGNEYEGGQGSIYSGWTNAPISIAFLFELCNESFLPPD